MDNTYDDEDLFDPYWYDELSLGEDWFDALDVPCLDRCVSAEIDAFLERDTYDHA